MDDSSKNETTIIKERLMAMNPKLRQSALDRLILNINSSICSLQILTLVLYMLVMSVALLMVADIISRNIAIILEIILFLVAYWSHSRLNSEKKTLAEIEHLRDTL